MMLSLLEGTLLMLLALAAGRRCTDPQRRTSLWLLALLVQPIIVLTGAAGLEWQPWVVTAAVTASMTADVGPTAASSSPFALFALAYAAGMLWRALPWLRSMLWAQRIVASAAAPRAPHWQALNTTLACSSRRRAPRLRMHAQVAAPFLTGALRPSICIPASLEFCDPARARHVLLHEHAHWRAHDWWRAQSVELIACLFWFHPVVHLLRGRFRRDLELACDARVLESGADARDYALTLLQLSRHDEGSNAMALGMATKRSHLVERVACLMNPPPARKRARRWPFAVFGAAGLAACAINPLPRVVYVLMQPPPLVVEASTPMAVTAPNPSTTISASTPSASDDRTEATVETAPRAMPQRATPRRARPNAASTAAVAAPTERPEPAPTPPSTAQLYRSLAQIARDDVPWPTPERNVSLALDTAVDPRFEEGMRKGRIERDQRIQRNWNRAFMLTGNIPLKPTIEIQPTGGGVRLRVSEPD